MQAAALAWLVRLTPCAKWLTSLATLAAIAYVVTRVPLGELTFVQHVQRIWQTDEVKDLREGVAHELSGAKDVALEKLKERLAASRSD